jgi:hypothetical protein
MGKASNRLRKIVGITIPDASDQGSRPKLDKATSGKEALKMVGDFVSKDASELGALLKTSADLIDDLRVTFKFPGVPASLGIVSYWTNTAYISCVLCCYNKPLVDSNDLFADRQVGSVTCDERCRTPSVLEEWMRVGAVHGLEQCAKMRTAR